MKKSEYLYGKPIQAFPYAKSHYKAKICSAKELLKELVSIPLENRDEKRVNDVLKAISFNEQLLKEYYE